MDKIYKMGLQLMQNLNLDFKTIKRKSKSASHKYYLVPPQWCLSYLQYAFLERYESCIWAHLPLSMKTVSVTTIRAAKSGCQTQTDVEDVGVSITM